MSRDWVPNDVRCLALLLSSWACSSAEPIPKPDGDTFRVMESMRGHRY